MSELNEIPIEILDEWVLSYLQYNINNKNDMLDQAVIVEGMLFYARDYLLDMGLQEKDVNLVNQAKAINSLVNILRKQPPVNNWNNCLNTRGLPLDEMIYP